MPRAADAQSARDLLNRGIEALKENRYRDAATHLDASYRLEQTPLTLYNLGLAYHGMGFPSKAVSAFESYVQFADATKDAETIAAVNAEIARIRDGHARFALSLDPANASITIDDQPARLENNELWVLPGQRRIAVSAPGYEAYEQVLEVAAGRFELDVQLRRPSGPPDVRATELLDEGDQLRSNGDLPNAETRYSAAQRILDTPRGAGSAGLAQESLGRLAEAEVNINAALAARRDKWVRKNRRRLRAAKRRLEATLATIIVTGAEYSGAQLFVDDEPLGTLPVPGDGELRIQAGTRTLKATFEGYEDFTLQFTLPARGRRNIPIAMNKKQAPPVAAVVPPPTATPAAPTPEVGVATQAQTEAAAEQTEPQLETTRATKEDVEATVDAYDEGEPPPEFPSASGIEMALGLGYRAWIDEPVSGAAGAFALRAFSIGYRPVWPVSFGVQLVNAHYDVGADAAYSFGVSPALYVRGHIQRHQRPLTFDVWGGIAVQPVSISAAFFEAEPLDEDSIDVNAIDAGDAAQIAQNEVVGIDDAWTTQSVNIPIEVGGAFFITESLAVELTMALTFWIPTQLCIHGAEDRVCYEDDIDTMKSFYIGGGLSFLP